jgi:hypothetical protein
VKTTLLLFWLSTFFFVHSFGAETEKPPENIIKHYEWCALPTDIAMRMRRYESFWSRHHPKDEQYDDMIHGTFVRHCAYRLAELYADSNNPKKCREFLAWLEAHDQALPK